MPPTPRARKVTTPTPPAQPETTELDTSAIVAPSGDDETPIHDQLKKDLENADPDDVTLFEEDDNPLEHVGEVVDEEAPEEEKP